MPELNLVPSFGIVKSLVTVAEATEPSFITLVPDGEVVKKSKSPAVAVLVKLTDLSLAALAITTSAAEALTPALTLPAGLPTAEIPDIVKKYEDPVAVPALAPVIDSV